MCTVSVPTSESETTHYYYYKDTYYTDLQFVDTHRQPSKGKGHQLGQLFDQSYTHTHTHTHTQTHKHTINTIAPIRG